MRRMRILIARTNSKAPLRHHRGANHRICSQASDSRGFECSISAPSPTVAKAPPRPSSPPKTGEWCECRHHRCSKPPRDREIRVQDGSQFEAIMEMSAASGLAIVSDLPLDPATASTLGTGLMMLDAIQRGVSASSSASAAAPPTMPAPAWPAALGFRFLDADGQPNSTPSPRPRQAPSHRPAVGAFARMRKCPEILVACDVTNPLLGPEGCTRVYGPQKGVKDFAYFEARLAAARRSSSVISA
jgi:glycerate kinase